MIKSYTFKVMAVGDDVTKVICCIHCPLEIFYESFKKTPELEDLYKNSSKSGFKFYVRVTDLPIDNGGLDENNYNFCTLEPLVYSDSFKKFLASSCVLDLETLEASDDLIESFARYDLL